MKKLLIIALAALCLTGCSPAEEPKGEMYVEPGHYYTSGEVITFDGNVWAYSHNETIYNGEPVFVIFYDSKTPDYIYDDQIISVIKNDDIALCP